MDKLPIYNLTIDENTDSELEVSYVALVDAPAIEKNFLAFKDKKPFTFAVNEEKRIISGPAMLADFLIYRRDDDFGEYMVMFQAQTILQIAQKFFSKNFNSNFNLFHDPELKLDGVTVFESFIVDETRGIKPMAGFEDAAQGSWFISAKVNDDVIWDKIKKGELKGFSVEGMFKYKKLQLGQQLTEKEKQFAKEFAELLKGIPAGLLN